jgi:tyrosinase
VRRCPGYGENVTEITNGAPAVLAVSKTNLSVRRYRKSVTGLTDTELAALRSALTSMTALSDDRGFEFWAGIHGLPLPISCWHGSPLFLPWHRAYLYYFEQHLLDQMPAGQSVSLPWWDWSTQAGIPAAYADATLPDGTANPLAGAPISGIPAAQFNEENMPAADQTFRQPGPAGPDQGPNGLPSAEQVSAVLGLNDFDDFTNQVEDLHNQVHVWVGGTMSEIPVAAFDPLFWAHHTMIDRIWALWQLAHPGAGVGSVPPNEPLGPFPTLTVANTLSTTALGYDYASATSSAIPA